MRNGTQGCVAEKPASVSFGQQSGRCAVLRAAAVWLPLGGVPSCTEGRLMALSANEEELFRRPAEIANKVLKGANPDLI